MNEEKKCPVNCLVKLIVCAIPVALFLMAAEYVIHMNWLMPLYKTTPSLWRTDEDMKAASGGGMCLLRIAAMSIAITALYCKAKKGASAECSTDGKKKCPVAHGLCFGAALGLLMGTMMGSSYFWMPISSELGWKWFIAGFAEGLGSGFVLGLVCLICSKKCGTGNCSTGTK